MVSLFCNFSEKLFDQKSPVLAVPGLGPWHAQNQRQTDIATYKLNQPRGLFIENL